MNAYSRNAVRPDYARTCRSLLALDLPPHATAPRGGEEGGAVRGAAGRDRDLLVTGLGGLAELAHGGLQGGLDRLVALVSLVVLLVPLDLGLDVRHYCAFVVGVGMVLKTWCCRRSSQSAGARHATRKTSSVPRGRPNRVGGGSGAPAP